MQQAQQLGRYHLLDRVAFGGMAEIYRAKTADAQGRLHLVAVKRVLSHLCEDDEFIQMLIDEARLTAMLKHENIARVYEFCRTPNEYFIAMEYVDGKDLRALLEKARQNQEWLPEEHIAYICMYVARGLHAAHMQTDRYGNPLNIVHRDVSPSNVLLSYAGEVKLCDFGIAKAASSRSQTKTGVIKGKVKYMSPEQAMGRRLDRRSDLFSLGTLLYEMLALQAPFTAGTEIELLFAVRDARKRPIRELRPRLNADLEVIIERAMTKSRSQRFQSGEEFAAALQAFLETYYPNYSAEKLSRYLLRTFEHEREREQRLLDEYVISSGSAEQVGENLLADVLGPDAEYTQFTAAFSQLTSGQVELIPSGFGDSHGPHSLQRGFSSASVSGLDELDVQPTFERQRMSAQELGLNAAQTLSFMGSSAVQLIPGRPSAKAPHLADESDLQTVILQKQSPQEPLSLHSDQTAIVGERVQNIFFDDGLHAQETAILPRQEVDALLAQRGLKLPERPAPTPPALSPYKLADEPELHEAATQILGMSSLPENIRELLQKRVEGGGTPAPAEPAASPAVPSLKLQPLDADFHDARTAYLDWSPIEPLHQSELPMPEPSVIQSVRGGGPARTATGAHAPIAPSPAAVRSPTGAQVPIAPPRPPSAALLPSLPRTDAPPHPSEKRPTEALSPRIPAVKAAPVARVAAPLPPQPPAVPAQNLGPPLSEEWENLPHLDSTLIARSSQPSQSVAIPTSARASMQLPRVGAGESKSEAVQSAPDFASDTTEQTFNTESQEFPLAASPFEDLPTPVTNRPALRDLGIDAHADFAEDTNKGGLPRGFSPDAHQVDAGQYLNDDDLEPIE